LYKCNQVEGRRDRIIRRSTTTSIPSLTRNEAQGKTGDVEEVIKNTTKIIIMKAREAIIMTGTTKMIPRLEMLGTCPKTKEGEEDGKSTKAMPRPTIATTRAASSHRLTKKALKKKILLKIKKKNKTRQSKSKRVRPLDNNLNTRNTKHSNH